LLYPSRRGTGARAGRAEWSVAERSVTCATACIEVPFPKRAGSPGATQTLLWRARDHLRGTSAPASWPRSEARWGFRAGCVAERQYRRRLGSRRLVGFGKEMTMTDPPRWYAGIDWATQSHQVWLTDGDGRTLGEKEFAHSGKGLAEMIGWLLA